MKNQSKKLIFWLDDQPHFLDEYQEELRRDDRLMLDFQFDVDVALERLKDRDFHPDLLIWDMMLPHQSLDAQDTVGGERTGEVFYKQFRARFRDIPAILFTNVSEPRILAPYDKRGGGHVWAHQKRDLLPDDFVTEVLNALELQPLSMRQQHA